MKTKKLATLSCVAAIYAVTTIAFAFMSYQQIQFRLSEALCVLPFFFPEYTISLTIGCLLSNIISGMGVYDMVFGSLATLLAGLCTAWVGTSYRKRKDKLKVHEILTAPLFPVIFNSVIIGLMITVIFEGASFPFDAAEKGLLAANMLSVGLGEFVCVYLMGVPFMFAIVKNKKLYDVLK